MLKQTLLFADDSGGDDEKYTGKIEAPVYEPKHKKPHVIELYNNAKAQKLISEIEKADIPSQEKKFLIEAAARHTVFNYEKIADYYAHSPKEMQELMEASALVIIDFDKAIEGGFIRLCEDIRKQYMEEYIDADPA